MKKLMLLAMILTALSFPIYPAQDSWLLDSYDHGTITLRHNNRVYVADCQVTWVDGKRDGAAGADLCGVAVQFVGQSIPNAQEGHKTDLSLTFVSPFLFLRFSSDSGEVSAQFKVTVVRPERACP